MGTLHHSDPAPQNLGALLAVIPSLPRQVLHRLVARMIDRMDEIDGDPDLEPVDPDLEDTHDREQDYEDEPEHHAVPRYAIDQRLLLGPYSHLSGSAQNVDTGANQRL